MIRQGRLARLRIAVAAAVVLVLPLQAQKPAQPGVVAGGPDVAPPPQTDPVVGCQATASWMRATGATHVEPLLAGCPMFARAIQWEAAPGELVPYREWTVVQQARLDDLFGWLMQGVPDLGLACPDTHVAMTFRAEVYLRESEAFGIYAAHVAHALYLEVTGRVPWSLVTVPDEELQVMFASPSYFVRAAGDLLPTGRPNDPAHTFVLPERAWFGDGMICDPRAGYRFLTGFSSESGANLLRATEADTLAQISVWLAHDVGHGGDEEQTLDARMDYSYLTDRLTRRSYRTQRIAWAGAGCHSATSIVLDLARSVNIPLLAVRTFSMPPERWPPNQCYCHQGLLFHWTRPDIRIEAHTDDLYAVELAPFFPIDADGRPVTGDAAARVFFDVTWVRPKTLSTRRFVTYKDLTPFPRAVPAAGRHFAQPIYGTWDSPSRVDYGLTYDQRWELCTWTHFVQREGIASFDMEANERSYGPLLMTHAASTFDERAAACSAAYGGHAAFEARANAWLASRGSNLYVPFHLAPLPFPLPSGLPW